MNINPDLKLVVPIRRDEEGKTTVHGYHTPISREVFEANYRILAATHAALFNKGLAFATTAGPQIAALRLKDEGKRDAVERGEYDSQGHILDGGAGALLAEIKRSTTILSPGANGWDMLPVDAAVSAGRIDSEDWREVESSLVLFTCGFCMSPRNMKSAMTRVIAGAMEAQTSLLPATDFLDSLAKSTPAHHTHHRAASSVPS